MFSAFLTSLAVGKSPNRIAALVAGLVKVGKVIFTISLVPAVSGIAGVIVIPALPASELSIVTVQFTVPVPHVAVGMPMAFAGYSTEASLRLDSGRREQYRNCYALALSCDLALDPRTSRDRVRADDVVGQEVRSEILPTALLYVLLVASYTLPRPLGVIVKFCPSVTLMNE